MANGDTGEKGEKAITTTIDPDSWDERAGPGSYAYVKETRCMVSQRERSGCGSRQKVVRN